LLLALQLMPAGLLVTWPLPAPFSLTVKIDGDIVNISSKTTSARLPKVYVPDMPCAPVLSVATTFVAPVTLIVKASVAGEATKPCTLTGAPEIGVILKVFPAKVPLMLSLVNPVAGLTILSVTVAEVDPSTMLTVALFENENASEQLLLIVVCPGTTPSAMLTVVVQLPKENVSTVEGAVSVIGVRFE